MGIFPISYGFFEDRIGLKEVVGWMVSSLRPCAKDRMITTF